MTTPAGRVELTMPQEDWFEGHNSLLLAMGIIDRSPVLSEKRAQQIASNALRMASTVQLVVGSGKRSGGKREQRA